MNRLTVKQYAEKNNISVQTVYTKMKRKKDLLKGHIYYIKGVKYLDEKAQELLMPEKQNTPLLKKVNDLQKSLDSKTSDEEYYRNKYNKLKADYDTLSEKYENQGAELSEKTAEIENLKNTVAELTAKSTEFDNIKNRLGRIFDFFEDSKNTGILKKVGSYISKGEGSSKG